MTVWNYIFEMYQTTKRKCIGMYHHIKDYINGHHDMWIFIPGHSFPISLNNLNNTADINWVYDNSLNLFTLCSKTETDKYYKFSWLSAKIKVIDSTDSNEISEYDIDSFIESFAVNTKENIIPTLYLVFMCWCAHTKHWFKMDDRVEFHIIDDMGQDVVYNLDDHNNLLTVKLNKLCVEEKEVK
jgi:hypothetical protein